MEKKSFETALKELELIVSEMEGGDLALDESLKKIRRRNSFITILQKELIEQRKIEILLKKKN
ncbi:MAG: exodeoxyribonuclease VII small subunit [bacterium]|nr:exodeoxyribonuclease VII small subunit [bacterium]